MINPSLGRARRAARNMMIANATVTRNERGFFDEATGDYAVTPTQLYDGVCRIRSSWDFQERVVGDAEQRLNRPALIVPYETDTSGWRPGDVVVVTGDGAATYTLVGNQRIDSAQTFRSWMVETVESDAI